MQKDLQILNCVCVASILLKDFLYLIPHLGYETL